MHWNDFVEKVSISQYLWLKACPGLHWVFNHKYWIYLLFYSKLNNIGINSIAEINLICYNKKEEQKKGEILETNTK